MRVYFPGGKKVYADFNGFTHKTDQPVNGGGDESSPAPFDMFLASMGTCAGIYVLGFCQRRNIDTAGIEIAQSHNFNPLTKLIDKVNIEIKLPELFPKKYSDALIRVAQMCAVKKHLENPLEFQVKTKFN
jgi:putative redox protein